ncbi:MAG: tyrosine-type recombinase/integrase [Cetobacterium sp.]|nr:tyrosine-type recombinase/integrase [Cetobacterium sp.]
MKVEPIRDPGIIQECIKYLEAKSKRDALLFNVGIWTGLRVSDILKLRVKDLYNKSRLDVTQTKTGNIVHVPISPKLKKRVKSYVEDNNLQSYDYLIRSRKGINKPITRQQAYNILNGMAKYIGLENIGTHTLRKTAGYHMYKSNKNNIGVVMELLGHKDSASTLRYIGITDMDIHNGIRNLPF